MSESERQASLIMCDELTFGLSGKWNAFGIYVSDIQIADEEQLVPQLVFIFDAETALHDPFLSLAAEVLFPGDSEPKRTDIPILPPPVIPAGQRKKLTIRFPLLVRQQMLRPGRIQAFIQHERGKIEVAAPWILGIPVPQVT